MKSASKFLIICLLAVFVLSACGGKTPAEQGGGYVLTTALQDGKLVFVGVGRDIAGVVNPTLKAAPGEEVTVTLINGEGAEHDIFFPDVDAKTERVNGQGKSTRVTFTAPSRDGSFVYVDSVPGHAEAGMQGYLLVGNAEIPVPAAPVSAAEMPAVMETSNEATIVAFQKGACASCHTIPGIPNAAGVIGPNLSDIVMMADEHIKSGTYTGSAKTASEFIHESIEKPDAFLSPTCPTGPCAAGLMPATLSTSLNSDEITAIVQYLSGLPDGAYGTSASAPVAVQAPTTGADVARDPTDLPAPIGNRAPTTVRIDLEAVEVEGQLADGTTYTYWTFNGAVPGPFLRVRVGDTLEVHMKNSTTSVMNHSVDFHAVTGPGGGAVMTQTQPGAETMFTAKALNPGLFVYHCATPMVAQHIANGMYGLILVEPEGGLPAVDREFYVMQGEVYTAEPFGTQGHLNQSTESLLNERPEYLVFNGTVGALTAQKPLTANVGETVRIFFGVGGPNFTSSFHVIGEIFDRVFSQASLTSAPLTDVQTTSVPPGGATMVEFKLEVPGRYILVDHALSRLQRGLAGYLTVEGPAAPEIFNGTPSAGSGH